MGIAAGLRMSVVISRQSFERREAGDATAGMHPFRFDNPGRAELRMACLSRFRLTHE